MASGVADALGVPRFVVAGNSLGGYVAWATAVLHPRRVDALVLVDAAGYPFEAPLSVDNPDDLAAARALA